MNDYKLSEPMSPCVLEPSKFQLVIDCSKYFLQLAYRSYHRCATNEKPPTDLDFEIAIMVSKPINFLTLVNCVRSDGRNLLSMI